MSLTIRGRQWAVVLLGVAQAASGAAPKAGLDFGSEVKEPYPQLHGGAFAGAAVRLVCQTKPANYTGSFTASDPMLTRIWYTGAYAVKLNLLKDYFGAILMDRGDRIS